MKKILSILICSVVAVCAVACSGGGAPSDAKKLANDTLSLTESTTSKLNKASSAKEASEALIAYAAEMKKITDRSAEFQKKYPNFDMKGGPDSKEYSDKMQASATAFSKAMTTAITKYAGSKEMLDAIMKMSSSMKGSK